MCGECEWADRSWKILLLIRKSWLLPALPANGSGKQLSPTDFSLLTWRTTLCKLNHSKPQRQVTPYHKRSYIHALLDFWRYIWIKNRNHSWERFYSLKPDIYYPATPPKGLHNHFWLLPLQTTFISMWPKLKPYKQWVNYEISKDTRKVTLFFFNLESDSFKR